MTIHTLAGRFDDSVIEERRQSAMNLLDFVGAHSYLYKSKDFMAFLKVLSHVLQFIFMHRIE